MQETQTERESRDGVKPERAPQADLSSGGILEALRFLLPLGRRERGDNAAAYARAARWIVPIGLLIGLLWAGCFRLTWRYYGETGNLRLVPALAVVLLECLLTGFFLVRGLAHSTQQLVGGEPESATGNAATPLSAVGALAMCLIVLSQWVLIVSIPQITGWWPSEADWRHHLNFLYPRPILRPLLLAPLWGRWGILLAASIGRTAPGADAETVALCTPMRPGRLLLHAVLPTALSAIYFSRRGNLLIGVTLAMIVFGLTYVASVVMARRGGGQTRQTLFAAGQIAQLAFLAAYRAFWPLIHG